MPFGCWRASGNRLRTQSEADAFLLWLSTGLRNGEIRGVTWDCIRWEEGEVLICKSLRRDGYSTGDHSWAPTKTGKERVVPLTEDVLEVLRRHQKAMEAKELLVHMDWCWSLLRVTGTFMTKFWVGCGRDRLSVVD